MAVMAACSEAPVDEQMNIDGSTPSQMLTQKPVVLFSANYAVPGEILVKFRSTTGDALPEAATMNSDGLSLGVENMDNFLAEIGASSMERLFPNAGRFEARTRKAGLHLWYRIVFDKSLPMAQIGNKLATMPELAVVEYVQEVKSIDGDQIPVEAEPQVSASTSSIEYPFNDPMLDLQWHYQNDGSLISKAVAGADVNAVTAWQREKGSRDVIVAVIDGAVDYDHEDLNDNMWFNEAEVNGTPGVDDDGNGYVDDYFGYDFCNSTGGYFSADDHGTHVAGTIAAVNNNGIGVSGVAGGSGSNDGVRIMSLRMFDGDNSASTYNVARAFKYGADNGAVICQNSWGYTSSFSESYWNSVFSSLKEAMYYFIDYAGMNEDATVQEGPMAGGLVVFSAGNEGHREGDATFFPGADEGVVAVASMGIDYKPAYYTCYGTWVDVTAPGGDDYFTGSTGQGSVLSTLPNNKYGYMEGTSMACPHVSGIAALAISYAEHRGVELKAADLKRMVIESTHNFDAYMVGNKAATVYDEYGNTFTFNLNMADYRGKMGSGYVDAAMLLDQIEGIVTVPEDHVDPAAISGFEQTGASVSTATIEWQVTADYVGDPVKLYNVYWSEEPLQYASNGAVQNATVKVQSVKVEDKAVGETLSCTMSLLQPQTTYYVGVVAVDQWNGESEPYTGTVVTSDRELPAKITDVAVSNIEYTSFVVKWTATADCIGSMIPRYKVMYSTSSDMSGAKSALVTGRSVGSAMSTTIKGLTHNTKYYVDVIAIDQWSQESEPARIEVKTKENLPPVVTAVNGTSLVTQYWSRGSLEFTVEEPNGDEWSAEIANDEAGLLTLTRDGNKLTVTLVGNRQNVNRDYAAQLVVTDAVGMSAEPVDLTYRIIGNVAPVAREIEDIYMGATGVSQNIDLSIYFSDENGETLSYEVTVNGSSVKTSVDGNTLVVTGSKFGLSTVTVVATDAAGDTARTSFQVMVRDNSKEVEIYPNPVYNDMNIRMGQSVKGTISVKMYGSSGSLALETTATIEPFSPAKIDVSSLGAGSYVVEVEYNGTVYKSNIVKK